MRTHSAAAVEDIDGSADRIAREKLRLLEIDGKPVGLDDAAAPRDDHLALGRQPMQIVALEAGENEQRLRPVAETNGDAGIGNAIDIGAR